MKKNFLWMAIAAMAATGVYLGAQEQDDLGVENHSSCSFFGEEREKYAREKRMQHWRGRLTSQVTNLLPAAAGAGPKRKSTEARQYSSVIDREIFGRLEREGIAAAPLTNDFEFARRVSLDLTGRVPSVEALLNFVGDNSENKRQKYVEQLIGTPEWVDKWTMYYGDLFRNTRLSDVTPRFDAGRNAFYRWIKTSLEEGKPYDVMARELIASRARNTFEEGAGNFLLGSDTAGGPIQDDFDQMAADVARTFLGVGHMNCLLCHNGRGHLDTLSLWGRNAKRSEAYGLAAYFARTRFMLTRPDPATNNNLRYYSLVDQNAGAYSLNTTTGNRPARTPVDGLERNVNPKYPFGGQTPASNELYREALATTLTQDIQFARATVNYMWAALMGRGLVEPLDQMDPARLDPANPPENPDWKMQASHPVLLQALAEAFVENKYDLRWLMREITTSEAYQLSSRYEGEWNPANEETFARRLVRRLWGEEIHDAIATTSGLLPTYNVPNPQGPLYTDRTQMQVRFAMQLPETGTLPDNGAVAAFLNSFARGNRLDDDRKGDASVLQALNLMNDALVMTRIRSSVQAGQESLLRRALTQGNNELVDTLFLTVLSRFPQTEEKATALKTLEGTSGTTRTQRAENLLWSLYNKVDFIFNY